MGSCLGKRPHGPSATPALVTKKQEFLVTGEEAPVQTVTLRTKDCTFGTKPFYESIIIDFFVPEEAVEDYKKKFPQHAQIYAIPEARLTDGVIVWDEVLCKYIWDTFSEDDNSVRVTAHNTQGGITATFTGTDVDSGFGWLGIKLLKGEKLTFTSAVGNISQITIRTDGESDTPVAKGWTWDEAKNTFTWQGTPATVVEMVADEEVNLCQIEVCFTIGG